MMLQRAEHDSEQHPILEECVAVALYCQECRGREQESSRVHQIPL